MVKVEPGKRYWRADGKLTNTLLEPSGHPPVVAAVDQHGRAYTSDGEVFPILAPSPAHVDAAQGLRLVREYVPPVEVFTDYRIQTSDFQGMGVMDAEGSGCVKVCIPSTEADAETLRVWAAVLLDMAETLDKLPR
jgi:hypothetical protein